MNLIIKFEEQMSRIRHDDWKEQGIKQTEILSYMKIYFHIYTWSERTLKRIILFFKLRSSDTQRTLQEERNVIKNEN